jgi:NADPH2:quinone reductase
MLSKAWEANVIATAGSAEKCEACLGFGAKFAINYREADFVARLHEITEGRGADVVLDLVGGPYLERNIECLAVEGRVIILATLGGRSGSLDVAKLMHKRAWLTGSTMRSRSPEEKGMIAERLLADVWPLLPAKDPIRPVIDSTFPVHDASLAHARMESGAHIGKIVLTIP